MTDIWPHEDVANLNKFYGDPNGGHGYADNHWEAINIKFWVPPYPMFYSDGKKTPFKHGLRLHVKCHQTFTEAFTEVLRIKGHDYIVQHHLDISGGTYNFRLERGGSRLSVHAWGCAIDMDPARNRFPSHWRDNAGMIDMDFANIMQKHGFCWRGAGIDNDPMHFSWPTIGNA
jgi:hypothetical protein